MGGEYEFLAQLKKDAERYSKYLETQEEIVRHENSIKTMTDDIANVLNRYPVDKSFERLEQIQSISIKKREYLAIKERIEDLRAEISKFEAEYDVNEQVKSVDDLQQQQSVLDEQIMELNKQIIQERENLSQDRKSVV